MVEIELGQKSGGNGADFNKWILSSKTEGEEFSNATN